MESGNAALGQIMAMFEQSAAMLGSWLGGFSPKASTIGNLGDFFFFRYILGYLSDKIHDLGFDMLVRVSVTRVTRVPEPGTLGLLAMGLAAVAGRRNYRRRSTPSVS